MKGGISLISKYVRVVGIDDDVYAIYNNLLFKPVFARKTEIDEILEENVSAEYKKALKDIGIYIKDQSVDDVAFERLSNYVHNRKRKVKIMYLIVSTFCNLNCKYCFIERNPSSKADYGIMSFDIAREAVNQFFSSLEQDDDGVPEILFYGGEPLIAQSTIKETVRYVRENFGEKPKLTIISNGTLLTDSFAKFMNKYRVGIGISIDGPKDITDFGRVFRESNDSVYENVCEKIEILKKNNCNYGLSITITPEVIDKKEEIFSWILNFGVSDIFWNLYHFPGYDKNWEEFYVKLSDFILESYDRLTKNGIRDGRINELLELFYNDTFKFESCGALGLNQVAIAPNGDIFICHGDNRNKEKKCGSILENSSFATALESENAKQFESLLTIEGEECKNCDAFFVCGGGCPGHAESLFGSRSHIDLSTCIFSKRYLLWILKKFYEDNA